MPFSFYQEYIERASGSLGGFSTPPSLLLLLLPNPETLSKAPFPFFFNNPSWIGARLELVTVEFESARDSAIFNTMLVWHLYSFLDRTI